MRVPSAIPAGTATRSTGATGIGRFDFLCGLPDPVRGAVSAALVRRRYPAGRTIYWCDEPGDEMFRLVAGTVRLLLMRADGRELVFTQFQPGDCFGTASLVDNGGRPHTAVAQTDVVLDVLSRAAFERLHAAHPEFALSVARVLTGHMRTMSVWFAGAVFEEIPSRLARRLVDVATPDAADGVTIRLVQSELALMLGASRQTVNKILHQFQERGVIQLSYGAVIICDLRALRTIAAMS